MLMNIAPALPPRQKEVLSLIHKLTEEHGYPPTLAELAKAMGLRNRMTVHQHVVALKKKGLVRWEPGLNRSLRALNPAEMGQYLSSASDGEDLMPEAEQAAGVSAGVSAGISPGISPGVSPGISAGVSPGASPRISAGVSRKTSQAKGSRGGRSQGAISQGLPPPGNALGIPLAGIIAAGSPLDAIQSNEFLQVDSQYGDDCFALKIKGDSMIDDGIYDGDYVIVKPNPSPLNGAIVVATLEDGTATLKRFFKENGRFRLQPANPTMEPIFIDGSHPLEIQGVVVALFRKLS